MTHAGTHGHRWREGGAANGFATGSFAAPENIIRLVRCLAAETPNVSLEKRCGVSVLDDGNGSHFLRCFIRVSQGCDCERCCEEFLARLDKLVTNIPGHDVTRLELCVTGRY